MRIADCEGINKPRNWLHRNYYLMLQFISIWQLYLLLFPLFCVIHQSSRTNAWKYFVPMGQRKTLLFMVLWQIQWRVSLFGRAPLLTSRGSGYPALSPLRYRSVTFKQHLLSLTRETSNHWICERTNKIKVRTILR